MISPLLIHVGDSLGKIALLLTIKTIKGARLSSPSGPCASLTRHTVRNSFSYLIWSNIPNLKASMRCNQRYMSISSSFLETLSLNLHGFCQNHHGSPCDKCVGIYPCKGSSAFPPSRDPEWQDHIILIVPPARHKV